MQCENCGCGYLYGADLETAAKEWAEARVACLTLPVTPEAYERLARAEAALVEAVRVARGADAT